LTKAGQTVNIEDAKHVLQSDKLLGDKIDEDGMLRKNSMREQDNDESGEYITSTTTDELQCIG